MSLPGSVKGHLMAGSYLRNAVSTSGLVPNSSTVVEVMNRRAPFAGLVEKFG